MQNSTQINTQRAGIDKEILALRAKSIFFKVQISYHYQQAF